MNGRATRDHRAASATTGTDWNTVHCVECGTIRRHDLTGNLCDRCISSATPRLEWRLPFRTRHPRLYDALGFLVIVLLSMFVGWLIGGRY